MSGSEIVLCEVASLLDVVGMGFEGRRQNRMVSGLKVPFAPLVLGVSLEVPGFISELLSGKKSCMLMLPRLYGCCDVFFSRLSVLLGVDDCRVLGGCGSFLRDVDGKMVFFLVLPTWCYFDSVRVKHELSVSGPGLPRSEEELGLLLGYRVCSWMCTCQDSDPVSGEVVRRWLPLDMDLVRDLWTRVLCEEFFSDCESCGSDGGSMDPCSLKGSMVYASIGRKDRVAVLLERVSGVSKDVELFGRVVCWGWWRDVDLYRFRGREDIVGVVSGLALESCGVGGVLS